MAREESRAIFFMKVKATDSALKLIEELKAQHGEELLFHQSGGCCDGSAPMCYPRNEYMVGSSDVKLGEIGGLPFYMNDDQYEKWKHTDLTIDAVNGIGGMFSLDNGTGKRFLTKSEICLLYTSPSPRDRSSSRMPSSA